MTIMIHTNAEIRELENEVRAEKAEKEAARLRKALEGIENRTRNRVPDPGPCVDCVWGIASNALQSAPPASEPEKCWYCNDADKAGCPRCGPGGGLEMRAAYQATNPAPADRPEPSEALDRALDCLYTKSMHGRHIDSPDARAIAEAYDLVRRHLSQPAPAVPEDAVMCPFCESKGYVTDKKHKYQALNARMRTWHGPSVDDSTHSTDGDSPAVHPKYTRATMEELREVYSIVMRYIDKLNDPISEAQFNIDAGLMCDEVNDALAAAPTLDEGEH